jgi:hypothetical protein
MDLAAAALAPGAMAEARLPATGAAVVPPIRAEPPAGRAPAVRVMLQVGATHLTAVGVLPPAVEVLPAVGIPVSEAAAPPARGLQVVAVR